MWCPSRLCSRSSTFCHVYYPTQHYHLLTFSKPPPLRRRYSTFFSFYPHNSTQVSPTSRPLCNRFPPGCLRIFLLLTLLNEFLIIGLKQQLSKLDACNLSFTFDERLTFSDHISSLSKSCYSHIRELRYICPYLDSKTDSTIAASIVDSKLDYCNSLYYNLPNSQVSCLQQIQDCLACTMVKAPKSSHITPILRSLHWLKINEHIKSHSPTKFSQPANLTCSSSLVTLAQPSVSSSLQITNCSFTHASPYLWNELPSSFRQPHSMHSLPGSPHSVHTTSSPSPPLLYHSLSLSLQT